MDKEELNQKLIENAKKENLPEVVKLIELGADIYSQKDERLICNIIGYVSEIGRFDLVKQLVENSSASNDAKECGLIGAAYGGHLEIVKYFVGKEIDVHAENNEALIGASYSGHLEVIKYLVAQGGDIHAQENRALIEAAYNGHLEAVKYLVVQGANIHAQNDKAIVEAAYNGSLEVVKYLVVKGANIYAQENRAIIDATNYRHLEIVKYFIIDCNADIQIPLEQAKIYKNYEVINWCDKYIQSKKLNDSLELDLKNDNRENKNKKVKI